tara:strand:+ start:4005 stop:5657 length:1653 start_codon:yes stop_codon:yes gene_type:complete
MTTIQDIINLNSSREAQKVMREVINTECTAGGYNWGDVIVAARNSLLINSSHEHSKKLSAMPTQAQLLDRMSAKALGIFIVQMVHDEGNCVETLRSAFEQPADNMEAWPYGDNIAMDFVWIYAQFNHLDISELISERDTSAAPTKPKPSAQYAKLAPTFDEDEDDAPAPTPLPVFNPALVTAANNVISVATEGAYDDLEGMIAHRFRQDERIIELEKAASAAPVVQPVVSDGTIPNGVPVRRNAQAVFGLTDPLLDFEIDCWVWDDTNPLVPVLDPDYVFDVGVLADLLWARENNKNAWLVGHTGTGKTTLVEQIMARTMSMFERVNFDSAITRVDFIGKVDVRVVNGASETYFKEGILPRAMRMPVTLLLDEADAIRGDIAYVLQPVLEGRPLRLLEDAGRMVEPHPQFRIMAAANSGGSGDSSGLYSAAVKVQSRAAMNRYNVFVRVNYMEAPEEIALVRKHVPDLSDAASDVMLAFLTNYRKGFADGEITTPISPRNMLTLGSYVSAFEGRIGYASALERGLNTVIFQSIDDNDAPVVRGIADRVTP